MTEADGRGTVKPKRGAMVELIGHRAGNTREGVESIRSIADTVEIDVHLDQGQLVVRHAKRVWFTSRLWERWSLVSPDTPVPVLGDVLGWIGTEMDPWIDCKGISNRLPEEVVRVAADHLPLTLSTKSWWTLRRVARRPKVRTIRSAGNRFELLLVRYLPSRVAIDGVVIHSRLLSPRLVADLRRRHGQVFTWSIEDVSVARQLISWGLDGLIIDDALVMEALTEPPVGLDDTGSDDVRDG